MNVTVEVFHWDSEGLSNFSGVHPYPGLKNHGTLRDVEIIFCYYQRDEPPTNPARKRRSASENDDDLCPYLQELASRAKNSSDPTSNSKSYLVNLYLVASLSCFVWAVM